MKKYGEDITMAGVPMHYSDSLREQEERKNVEMRKQALSSIIKSVQSYNKNGYFSNGSNLDSCRIEKEKLRRAFSYKHLPAIQEEDSEDASDEEADFFYKPRRKRRFSIGTENQLEQYADKKFFTAIEDIRSGKYLPDNVYHSSHPEREIPEESRYLNVERATQTDDNDLKLLWRLSRTIPPFKLADILGEFEMDPNGMFIIVRDAGKLKDKHGRLVNSRGYLIDEDGNVIHQNGTKIFNKDELDENNEIPAPFLFDEDEFDALANKPPELIPQPKSKPRRPPRPTANKGFKRKDKGKNTKNDETSSIMSKRSRKARKPPTQDRIASIMTDHPRPDTSKIESRGKKLRPITSDTKRPTTVKTLGKRPKPIYGNFTDGRTAKVKEETSDFNSTIGLEKINFSRKNHHMMNETNDGDDSDFKDTKEKLSSDGFFRDYMLNQRPEYYGDTSDIISRSRKLYY